MRTFHDNAGREWSITFRRNWRCQGRELFRLNDRGAKLDAIWDAIRFDADVAGVTRSAFEDACTPDTIETAWLALLWAEHEFAEEVHTETGELLRQTRSYLLEVGPPPGGLVGQLHTLGVG